ncbi:MAG: hypothetical protein J7521_16975 [Caulobacter sp.]|nr:hypothetical protein [Caulobacter sp.]
MPQPAFDAARRTRTRQRLAVGAASVGLHGLLAWGLLVGVPAPPTIQEPRSVDVELVDPDRETPRPRPARAPSAAPTSPAPHRAAPAPPGAPPTLVAPAAPVPRPPGGDIVAPPGFKARGTLMGGGDALREAARKAGCGQADLLKLTEAERAACDERLTAMVKKAPLYAVIDPEKKAAFDGECKKDDEWCLYRAGKGPYPGLFAIGRKKKIKGWDD